MADHPYVLQTEFAEYLATVDSQDWVTLAHNDAFIAKYKSSGVRGAWPCLINSTTVGITPGSFYIGTRLAVNSNIVTAAYVTPSSGNWVDIWAEHAEGGGFTITGVSSTGAPGNTFNPYSGDGILIASFGRIAVWHSYRGDSVVGWNYAQGNNSSQVNVSNYPFGVAFADAISPPILSPWQGHASSPPTRLESMVSETGQGYSVQLSALSTSQMSISLQRISDTFSSSRYYVYLFEVYGPRLGLVG